jgi:hypothetical protein
VGNAALLPTLRRTANDNDKIIHQQINLDELNERIARIEKRLELVS